MNVFSKVTIQSLKKNKTRTIVTIIGIMLSAAMICAVTTFISSVQSYLLDRAIYVDGSWHGSLAQTDMAAYERVKGSEELSALGYNEILGYAKVSSKNEYKPYLYVISGDKEHYFNLQPVHLLSGEYPKNSGEILIPEHALSDGGMPYKIGDKLTLELGERLWNGNQMWQGNPAYTHDAEGRAVLNEESIDVKSSKSYTIVGIYQRPSFEGRTAPGYTAITVSDEEPAAGAMLDIFFKMRRPAEVYGFMDEMELPGAVNRDVLMFSGVTSFGTFASTLINFGIIFIVLIMFGSVSLIYNAFAISVSERTKQFGLLSSIGATKKQLKKMVYFEAFAVSVIGIPLGILCGIGGIGVTLLLIGQKFAALMGRYDEPLRMSVSWLSVLVAVLVALVTVLISAWIPSKRATKITAVEAIRQSGDIKAKKGEVKTSKLTYKLFGLPGVIASKHYKRSKKKYRTTIISLFMSIVLFVSAAAFTDYMMESVEGGFATSDYDIYYYAEGYELGEKTPDELLDMLLADKDVTNGAYSYEQYFQAAVSEEYLTRPFIESLKEQDPGSAVLDDGWGEEPVALPEGYRAVKGFVYFVNDAQFDKLLADNKQNKADYYNANAPLALVLDRATYFDIEQERFLTTDAFKGDGAELSLRYPLSNGEFGVQLLKGGKTIEERPFYIPSSVAAHTYFIYPMSMYEAVIPAELQYDLEYSIFMQSKNHAASYANIKKLLLESGMGTSNLVDYAENAEQNRNVVVIIKVFAYGFIVLISLIAAANVFNTISTNISLRRREFAMLKSVGMTQKGFNKMMNFECLLYGSKSLLLGLPVAAGITYWMYTSLIESYETSFRLPWVAIGIAVLSVFLVVFSTMLYSMSKIKKDNPIEALKNENL